MVLISREILTEYLRVFGNAWSKDVPIGVVIQLAASMVWFASGALLAAFAHGLTYVSQASFAGGYNALAIASSISRDRRSP